MRIRRFEEYGSFKRGVIELLEKHCALNRDCPYGVILPGGATPLPFYNAIAQNPFPVSDNLHIIISDERYVDESSDYYNYANIEGMVKALGVPDERVIKVNTGLGFQEATDEFDSRLSSFIAGGGVISLGLLGLGADGHTASLFSREDLHRAEGRYATNVLKSEGPDRISLTPDLLSYVEKAIILTAGGGKSSVIDALECNPGEVIAGMALAGVDDCEVWHSLNKE